MSKPIIESTTDKILEISKRKIFSKFYIIVLFRKQDGFKYLKVTGEAGEAFTIESNFVSVERSLSKIRRLLMVTTRLDKPSL
jgi:hypothetical protein